MVSGYTNLIIESGSTFSQELTLTNPDGTSINLTGYSAASKMRKSYWSNFNVYDLTVTISSPSEGKLILSATPTQTSSIKPGRYVYDVEISIADNVWRVVEGIIEVRPNATR
jgi:hypothetical protein